MSRRRFFVDAIRRGHAEIAGEEAQHLTRVLRVEPGQRFEISDNQDVYLAEVEQARKDKVSFLVLERLAPEAASVRIALLASLIKFDRFEWLLEKATELGVERIVPVEAERSEKGLRIAADKRLARWRKIVLESSQQSRRAHLPEVCAPVRLENALALADGLRYFLEEEAGARPILRALPELRSATDAVSLLAGPEGGWTDRERAQFQAAGFVAVSLGPCILRTETAALAALAVIGAAWLPVQSTDTAVSNLSPERRDPCPF